MEQMEKEAVRVDHDVLIEVSVNVRNILKKFDSMESRISCLEGNQKAQEVTNTNFKDSIKSWTLVNSVGVVITLITTGIILIIYFVK